MIQKLITNLRLEQKRERKQFCRNIVHSIVLSAQSRSLQKLLPCHDSCYPPTGLENTIKYTKILENALETEKSRHEEAKTDLKSAYYQLKSDKSKIRNIDSIINKSLEATRLELMQVSSDLQFISCENEKLKKQLIESQKAARAAISESRKNQKRADEVRSECDVLKKDAFEMRNTLKRLLSQLCTFQTANDQKINIRERRSFVYNKKRD